MRRRVFDFNNVHLLPFGLRPWRSVVWMVGFFATLAMILAALL